MAGVNKEKAFLKGGSKRRDETRVRYLGKKKGELASPGGGHCRRVRTKISERREEQRRF